MQSVLECGQGFLNLNHTVFPAEDDVWQQTKAAGGWNRNALGMSPLSYLPGAAKILLRGEVMRRWRRSRGSEQRGRSQQGHGTLNNGARISH